MKDFCIFLLNQLPLDESHLNVEAKPTERTQKRQNPENFHKPRAIASKNVFDAVNRGILAEPLHFGIKLLLRKGNGKNHKDKKFISILQLLPTNSIDRKIISNKLLREIRFTGTALVGI